MYWTVYVLRELHVGGREPLIDRAGHLRFAASLAGGVGVLPEVLEDGRVRRLSRRFFPLRAGGEGLDRLLRRVEIRCGDPDEIAVANDADARHRLGLARVERGERRLEGRRAKDLSMKQAGALDVGRVVVRAGHEVAAVHLGRRRAGDRPPRRRTDGRRRGFGGERPDELLAARQVAVREKSIGAGVEDPAVGRREFVAPHFPARGREIDERLACGGGDGAKLRPHRRGRAAAEGAGVPGNEIGVAHDEVDRVHAHAQFLGDLLGERRADVLAHLDLAGEDGHAAVRVDRGAMRRAPSEARALRERRGPTPARTPRPRERRRPTSSPPPKRRRNRRRSRSNQWRIGIVCWVSSEA